MLSSKDILNHQVRVMRLELHDFRGFRFLELDFDYSGSITVFIADNGEGKTSVLDAVAGFLQYFLAEAIFPEEYESHFGPKDITNGEASSLCKISLELTYPYPAKEIFEVCRDVAEFLNEYNLGGVNAQVELNTIYEQWQLFIDDQEDGIEFPGELVDRLNSLLNELDENKNPKLKPEDSIKAAYKNGKVWLPNLNLAATNITQVSYTGQVDIIFELNKNGGRFQPKTEKERKNIDVFIAQLKSKIAFIGDYRESTRGYQLADRLTVLPLLAYYGGSAINTKFGEVGIKYQELPYQAYKAALEPGRFDFEDFFEWLNWTDEASKHKFALVRDSILEVLNADRKVYEDLCIEEGELKLYKLSPGENTSLPVEVRQLSAGERNLFALTGDLVKRAIQLNPLLFELDYDPKIGSYSNILSHTEGIVLIDEVDLHLHPKWQRIIIPKLKELFPKVQFLVTTHSPFVLQSVPPDQRIRLKNGQAEYFLEEHVSDYESTVIDYFLINDFFDVETERLLEKFRELLEEVAREKRDRTDRDFIECIKKLNEKGNIIKRVIAFELAQLNKKAN